MLKNLGRQSNQTVREGFKNPSHGIRPLGGTLPPPPPLPPPLNGQENLAKKVNGKGKGGVLIRVSVHMGHMRVDAGGGTLALQNL